MYKSAAFTIKRKATSCPGYSCSMYYRHACLNLSSHYYLQQLNDIEHHTITLEPVKFSYDGDEIPPDSSPDQRERQSASHLSSVESSDDEFFDADDQLSPRVQHLSVASAGPPLGQTSRSISVTTIEGDPPDVEEDKDFYETEDLGG